MTARDKWGKIQAIIGTAEDRIPGKKDDATLAVLRASALAEYRSSAIVKPNPAPVTGVDERSAKNIATLHPKVQPIAVKFLNALNAKLPTGTVAKIISGTRTFAEQDALYAKGRTAPGPKVTNARGGYSNHNYGVAFDIGFFKGATYIDDGPHYDMAGPIGEQCGLSWGGRWRRLVDKPHFEYPTGLSLAQMRQRVASGQPILT